MKIVNFGIKTKISNVYVLGSFSFFLSEDSFCHYISSIISFIVGDISSSFYSSSNYGFASVSRIEVCVLSSVLIIASFLASPFCKKVRSFEASYLIFQFLSHH